MVLGDADLTMYAARGVLYAWLLVLSLRVMTERLPRAWRDGGGLTKDTGLGLLAFVGFVVTAIAISGVLRPY